MIALLFGEIVSRDEATATFILKAGAVGYQVATSQTTFAQLPMSGEAKIHTYTHVAEDVLALYGFLTVDDLRLFKLLMTVSGIGPKAALNIMALPAQQLLAALRQGDLARLTTIKGVGRKLAERLVMELRDKLDSHIVSLSDLESTGSKTSQEAIDALVSLGYSPREAKVVIAKLPPELDSSEEMVRAALSGTSA